MWVPRQKLLASALELYSRIEELCLPKIKYISRSRLRSDQPNKTPFQ